jgi:molybdate/tungstate transport system substrate-binding protein
MAVKSTNFRTGSSLKKARISLLLLLNLFLLFVFFSSCNNTQNKVPVESKVLTVFHAGSLSVPMKNLAAAFEKENPGVKVQLEAGGSLACVRKITELNQICDVLALADFNLIDELIIPKYAQWNMLFATNEMCLVYTANSKKSAEISNQNWFELLADPQVRYGRSDPDADPCGYRTILTLKLADRLYAGGKDWGKLLEKDNRFMRGKETDLNALLESQTIDYMFNYKSVAVQHGFKFLTFPDSINLSDLALDNWYSGVQVDVRGTGPGSTVTQKGTSIVYGMTIPLMAPNPKLAERFVQFITDPQKGRLIIEQSGQKAITPRYSAKSVR